MRQPLEQEKLLRLQMEKERKAALKKLEKEKKQQEAAVLLQQKNVILHAFIPPLIPIDANWTRKRSTITQATGIASLDLQVLTYA